MHVPRTVRKSAIGVVGVALALMAGVWLYSGSSPVATFRRLVMRFDQNRPVAVDGDTIIPMVFDHQDHALSCEFAALKMALGYRGVIVGEQELIDAVGVDPTPKTGKGGNVIWGDPSKAFVGNIDGKMLGDGYGVHWQPIAKVAAAYRRVGGFSGGSVQTLVDAIRDGNPIVAWGYSTSGGSLAQWHTPDGTLVTAVDEEHAFVVHGFRGSADSPEGFFIMDPVYGERYLSTAAFLKNWKSLDNSGIIIY